MPYDMVLLDMDLPGLNGFDAARRIRAGEQGTVKNPSIPIVAMASGEDLHSDRYTACGIDAVVAKPVKKSELVSQLERWKKT